MKKSKKVELVRVADLIKSGLIPSDITKKYKIPKATLSRYTKELIELGCIENPSYATWNYIKEVPKRPKDTIAPQNGTSKKPIRGHAYIWVIEFLEDNYNWIQAVENYKKRHKKPKLSFSLICHKKVPRTIFKNKKIWLTKKGMTIYEPLDFFGKSSFQVKGMAVYEMDRLIKDLIKTLGLKQQFYRFTCSREHFAHTKNQMARQFNENKKKISVNYNGIWFWIDHSDGEHEQESNDANTSFQAQKYYEDQVKTGFALTPSKIMLGFQETQKALAETNKIVKNTAKNQDFNAKYYKSHVGATRDLSATAKKLDANVDTQNALFERIAAALEGLEK